MTLPDEIWFYEISKWLSEENIYHLRLINKKSYEFYFKQIETNFQNRHHTILNISFKYDDIDLFYKCLSILDQYDKQDRYNEEITYNLMFGFVSSALKNVFAASFLCPRIVDKLTSDSVFFPILVKLWQHQLDGWLYTDGEWMLQIPFFYPEHFKILIPHILFNNTARILSLYGSISLLSEDPEHINHLLKLYIDLKFLLPHDFLAKEKAFIIEKLYDYDSDLDQYTSYSAECPFTHIPIYLEILFLIDNYPYVIITP